ncbi:MAG: M14 metallopeptidase family protein [Acidobacteriota bacterium]
MRRKNKVSLALIFLFLLAFSINSFSEVPPPEKFLGFKVGEDKKLADYNKIRGYFDLLDKNSEWLKVVSLGKTTLNNDFFMAIITSPKNFSKLDYYRGISKKLADPRGVTLDEARKLSKEGKIVVLVTMSLHSTEIAASQMSMELAYSLITGKIPFDRDKVLDDIIFLLMPCINPDGNIMVVDWYNKYLGTEYEGGSMPWLYHHYAGHDNNRDWFMFNLKETRIVSKVYYQDWFPQIILDQHQMGSTGARLFVPPYMDPPNPNVHPLIWRALALIGSNMALDLEENGKKGVIDGSMYTGWWEGASIYTPWWHNMIGVLTEAASVRVASPIHIEENELSIERGGTDYSIKMKFPSPWQGGWWRLRDIVEYEMIAVYSLLETSSKYKEEFLMNFWRMGKDAIDKGKTEPPFAYLIPPDQWDSIAASKFIEIMMLGGIEVHKAKKSFKVENTEYPAGTYVILMDQPYRNYIKDMLERQRHPELRLYPGGPPIRPYDAAGWTLSLQMGVNVLEVNQKLTIGNLEKLKAADYPEGYFEGKFSNYILDTRINENFRGVNRILAKGYEVFRSEKEISRGNLSFPPGSFVVKAQEKDLDLLKKISDELHINFYGLEKIEGLSLRKITMPKIALYKPWVVSMDEGWTRLILENFEFNFKNIENKDFREGKLEEFDTIIIPDMDASIIINGRPAGEFARFFAPLPKEYSGGIEKEGLENLKKFIKNGGNLVLFDSASSLAIEHLDVPVVNALRTLKSEEFFCPGSLLKIKIDNRHPIGWGMPEDASAFFMQSVAFRTTIPRINFDRRVVGYYPNEPLLQSGWILGEENLKRKAAVVDVQYEKGKIILLGFRVQHRAQTVGTFKLFFNSLLLGKGK